MILEHARQHPDKTLGVIAFSQRQQMQVLDELEMLRREQPSLEKFFRKFDAQLGTSRFIAADVFTQADCTLYCSIEFAGWVSVSIPDDCTNLRRWWKVVGERPSAKA